MPTHAMVNQNHTEAKFGCLGKKEFPSEWLRIVTPNIMWVAVILIF